MLTVPEYNINAKQREFAGHTGRVFDVDLAEDGLCVTASEDGTAKVWRLADGRLEGQLAQSESKDEVLRVAWAPRVVREASGASLLAVAGADGFCNLWRGDDWSAPKSIQRLDHGGDQVYGCAWSACGDAYGAWLLTAAGAAVRTWDVNAGKSIKQWSYQEPRGDQAYVFDVQPAPRDADDGSLWRVSLGATAIPAAVQAAGMFWVPSSARRCLAMLSCTRFACSLPLR